MTRDNLSRKLAAETYSCILTQVPVKKAVLFNINVKHVMILNRFRWIRFLSVMHWDRKVEEMYQSTGGNMTIKNMTIDFPQSHDLVAKQPIRPNKLPIPA